MLEPDNATNRTDTDQTGLTQQTEHGDQPAAARGGVAQQPDQGDQPAAGDAAPPAKAPRKRAAKKATADGESPAPRKRATKKAAAKATTEAAETADAPAPRKRAARKAAQPTAEEAPDAPAQDASPAAEIAADAPPAKAPRKRAAKKAAATQQPTPPAGEPVDEAGTAPAMAAPSVLFVAPDAGRTEAAPERQPAKRTRRAAKAPAGPPPAAEHDVEPEPSGPDVAVAEEPEDETAEPEDVREAAVEEATGARRRRRRGRRGRGGRSGDGESSAAGDDTADETDADSAADEPADAQPDAEHADDESGDGGSKRRRRRRRRSGGNGDGDASNDDPPNTVVHVREPKPADDGVKGVKGSTRLEAKRQRRREGRDTGRRRPPILTEAEFLARRESVERVMAVRQSGERTQIAVLEDGVLVEHYVTRASSTSYVGNVYLGRVQNVLPSMEAAFVDIGKGRNGVLYAGEVNWDAAGLEGKSRAIENALSSGDTVLVQVTKDPIGHKGARLTSQISLPGRFLVYVPGGGMTGISRKLPDTERHRLKSILKKIVPEDAGVIIRTAAEGASEEELTRDVERLTAQWDTISKKAENTKSAPTLVHGEPDLAIRVVRDVFNEDFAKMVVQGDEAWTTVSEYVGGVAPDLAERVSRHTAESDVFADLRVDEQLAKALDRKVWLPSGGSLIIDRTEAMTVIDVNTGKFVGTGGNLEQTVTRNNLEAAEEIVRQLRLRDVGGIVVIDFIDMVLESNRELVLRRLTECLGRDRTKHQVAEVTSLGLVQMTRKRVGEGLLEAFSEQCATCNGRGVIVHTEPVDKRQAAEPDDDRGGKSKRKRGGKKAEPPAEPAEDEATRDRRLAAMAAIHRAAHPDEQLPAELEIEAAAAVLDAEPGDLDAYLADAYGAAGLPARPSADSDLAAPDSEPPAPGADTEPSGAVAVSDASEEPVAADSTDTQPEVEASSPTSGQDQSAREDAPRARPRRRRAASRPAGPPVHG